MKLILKILAGLALAAAAYFWATGLMDSLFGFRSPLRESPPPPQPATQVSPAGRVIFVLIDGLRLDTALDESVMPTLADLRQQGAWAASHSRPPSYSQSGYTVLLTGAWPSVSDGPAINLDDEEIYTFTQDNLFSAAKAAGMTTAISGYDWFEKLVPQTAVDASFYTPLDDREADRQVVAAALPWLDDPAYNLILIHLDQIDYAGHYEGGPLDPRWDEAARRVDDHLAEIIARLDFSRDTLFVTSDHGHIERGGHGGQDPVVLVEPFLLVGANVRPGSYADTNMVDVAPTLAALLRCEIPASSQGKPLLELLTLPNVENDLVSANYANQQKGMISAYAAATGLDIDPSAGDPQAALEAAVSQRLFNESLPRLVIAIVVLGFFGWLLWRVCDRSVLGWASGSVALFWIAFHLKYAFLDHRTYSLSSVLSADDIILSTVITTLLALLVGWLIAVIGLKLWRRGRADAANASADVLLGVLYSLLLVVGWNYFRNGLWPVWTLPADFDSMFLGFLSLLQILVIGALLPVFSGIAALVGKKRNQ